MNTDKIHTKCFAVSPYLCSSVFICGSKAVRLVALYAFLVGARAGAVESIDARDVIVHYGKVDARRATLVAECVRRAHGQLRRRLGLGIPARVTVRLLRVKAAFLGMSDGMPVELYAGMAYPASASIHVNMNAVDRDSSALAFTRTIRHELVHLAIAHSLSKPRLPRWFEEGLASEFASLPRGAKELVGASALKSLVRFPQNNKETLSRAYAQSDSVVRFLMSKRGAPAVKVMLHRIGAGERFEDALRAATGYTTDSLDAEWRSALWPGWGWRVIRFVLGPSMILLWAALIAIAGFFVVKRRRRREAEAMDAEF
jgi:hypothetical protein